MLRATNMGVGMVVVVRPSNLDALTGHVEDAVIIRSARSFPGNRASPIAHENSARESPAGDSAFRPWFQFRSHRRRIASGKLNAEIAVVISNVETAPGLELAKRAWSATPLYIPSQRKAARRVRSGSGRGSEETRCVAGRAGRLHADHQPLLSRGVSVRYSQYSSIAAAGVSWNGCAATGVGARCKIQRVHGPLRRRYAGRWTRSSLQAVVPILDDDTPETLAARILKEEHRIYSEAHRVGVVRPMRCAGPSRAHSMSANEELQRQSRSKNNSSTSARVQSTSFAKRNSSQS